VIRLRIAICDDYYQDLEALGTILSYHNKLTIDAFLSPQALLAAVEKGIRFDLMFLDIQMPEIDGFELAKRIKEIDAKTQIIFVTVSDKYVYDAYGLAWKYIKKPHNREEIDKHILTAMDLFTKQTLKVATSDGLVVLQIDEIIYIEVCHNISTIHTCHETVETRQPLASIEHQIKHPHFAKPFKGYIVNLNFIKKRVGQNAIMKNDAVIPISRGNRDEFLAALSAYIVE